MESREAGEHAFAAPDFHTLVDSPLELGDLRVERFEVLSKPHRYAIWPRDAAAVPRISGPTTASCPQPVTSIPPSSQP